MSDSYSWQGAQDAGSAVSEHNGLDFHIRQILAEVRTATLVKITKAPYDKSGSAITPGAAAAIGYVDVQPLVNQQDGQGNATPHAPVYRLSYYRYQGGHGAFISDPKLGDIGKMICADRDTSVVRATDAQGNPGSRRKHDFADGTFFGQTQAGTPTQYFAWQAQGFNMVDAYGNTLQGTAAGIVINGITIPRGGVSFDLKTHDHSNVTNGPDNSGPPVDGS